MVPISSRRYHVRVDTMNQNGLRHATGGNSSGAAIGGANCPDDALDLGDDLGVWQTAQADDCFKPSKPNYFTNSHY